jgi:hypothetical protein
LPKLLEWKSFVDGVNDELNKAAKSNAKIDFSSSDFHDQYQNGVVKNFLSIQQTAQKIKDEYFSLMQGVATDMAAKYILLKEGGESLLKEIGKLPNGLNDEAIKQVNSILQYANQRTSPVIDIGFDVKDKTTRFTYSEMLSFIELYSGKKINLDIIKSELIKVVPPEPPKGEPVPPPAPKTITIKLPARKLKVSAYKQWLRLELQKLADAGDNDDVVINNDI